MKPIIFVLFLISVYFTVYPISDLFGIIPSLFGPALFCSVGLFLVLIAAPRED